MAMEVDAGLLLRLVEALPLPVVGIDSTLLVTMWNAAAEWEFGWTAAEVLGKPNPTVPPEARVEWSDLARQSFAGRVFRNYRTYRIRRDGTRVDILLSSAVAYDDQGVAVATIGIYLPLDEIEAKEERARRAEQRARALLESTADLGILIFDEQGALRDANPIAEQLFRRRGDLRFPQLYADPSQAEADRARALEHCHAASEGYLVREDGTTFWADVILTVVQVNGERELILVVRDAEERRRRERALAEREAALRVMLDQLPAVVWTTDRNLTFTGLRGRVPMGNEEIAARREMAVGRNVRDMIRPGSDYVIEAMQEVLRGAPATRYSYEQAGRIFDVRVEPLREDGGDVCGTIAVAFDVTDRHRARDELRRLAAQVNHAEEEQRRRIAREIHDDLGQRLTALSLELGLLRRKTGDIAAEHVDGMAALIRETAGTVRRLASDLRPALLDDFGFNAAVETELTELRRRTGLDFSLSLMERDPPLDRGATTALYRIVQEALTNIARHADAGRVEVSVTLSANGVLLEIADDGRGITPEERAGSGTLGLVGIRERAWAYGGDVRIEAPAAGGTRVTVWLPLERE